MHLLYMCAAIDIGANKEMYEYPISPPPPHRYRWKERMQRLVWIQTQRAAEAS
jgi:hypothetical protein